MRAWIDTPQTQPTAVGARVLRFPSLRAPRGDQEGSAGTDSSRPGPLRHASVLLVEDDYIVAFDMQMLIEEQGATVLGPAASIEEALRLLDASAPAVAVLDVNLNGDLVFPLTEALQSRGIPYLFATAYADDERLFPAHAKSAPRLAKPVLPNVLIAQLEKLLS